MEVKGFVMVGSVRQYSACCCCLGYHTIVYLSHDCSSVRLTSFCGLLTCSDMENTDFLNRLSFFFFSHEFLMHNTSFSDSFFMISVWSQKLRSLSPETMTVAFNTGVCMPSEMLRRLSGREFCGRHCARTLTLPA